MEPTSLIDDDAEFWLPPEFLTDEDFLLEKENNGGGDENRGGFGSFELQSGFGSTVKSNGDDEGYLAGLTRQMVQSTLKDDFSGGFCGNDAFPARNENKVWGANRSPQSTLCVAGIGCCCQNQRSNQNCQSRVSSPATWDLYCVAAEEMARVNMIDDCNNHSSRGLLPSPTKRSSVAATAAKIPNNGSGYYNHQTLQYQKLQAIQFEQLKQQQLMKLHRQMVQQSRGGLKNGGQVDLSSSVWSNQLPRRDIGGSRMRAVFLGDHAGKRGSTGTGVFLPQHNTSRVTADTPKKPTLTTVLVPARVAQVLSENDVWRQRSNNGGFMGQTRAEQAVNEPRLPPDWAY